MNEDQEDRNKMTLTKSLVALLVVDPNVAAIASTEDMEILKRFTESNAQLSETYQACTRIRNALEKRPN